MSVYQDKSSKVEHILFAIKLYEELEMKDALKDPYRAFPLAGGRIFYDTTKVDSGWYLGKDPVLPLRPYQRQHGY